MTDEPEPEPEPEPDAPSTNRASEGLGKKRECVLSTITRLMDKSTEYEEQFRELIRADPTPADQGGQGAESTADHQQVEFASDQEAEFTADQRAGWISHLNDYSNQLQSSLLPCLRQQLRCLARSLDPTDVHQDPDRQLTLILEHLLNLEGSLDEIQSSFRRSFHTFRKNGVDYPELTLVKYLYVITKLSKVKARISSQLLYSYHEFINQIDLSADENVHMEDLTKEHKIFLQVHAHTADSIQLIDQLDEWIGLTEFGVLHGSWREVMTWICMPFLTRETLHAKQSMVIKKSPTKNKFHQMVTLVVPILKLARLFFKKLSDTATKRGDFGIDLALNLTQIRQLMSDSLMVFNDLNRISSIFKLIGNNYASETDLEDLSKEVQNLSARLKALFSNLHSYVLIYPLKIHFKTWCHTWDDEITCAVQKLNQTASEQALLTLVRNQL